MSRGFFPIDNRGGRRPPDPDFASLQKFMIALVALIGTIGWTLGLVLLLDRGTPEADPSVFLTLAGIAVASAIFLWAAEPVEFARSLWSGRPRLRLAIAGESTKSIVRLETALNNMVQGSVMFDAHERIVVCNDVYVRMYGLSRDVAKPGCLPIDLLRHRIETGGDLNVDAEQYRRDESSLREFRDPGRLGPSCL
jgi:PAS domain-containing protein